MSTISRPILPLARWAPTVKARYKIFWNRSIKSSMGIFGRNPSLEGTWKRGNSYYANKCLFMIADSWKLSKATMVGATPRGMIPHHLSAPQPREAAVKSLWRPFKDSKPKTTILHRGNPRFRQMKTQQCPYLRLRGLWTVQSKLSRAIISQLRP